jgi:hypothetical protein
MRRIIIIALSALPLAAAAFGGAVWLADMFAPASNSASVEMMQVLQDEHTQMADYIKIDTEAKRRAYATADQEAATLKFAALEQSRIRLAQIDRLAQAEIEAKLEPKSVMAKTATRVEHVAVRSAAVTEPLQLAQAVMPQAQAGAPQAVQPVQQRVTEGPVRSRLRELVSDVRRIPSMLQSAAGWVVDAVPAPKLPTLPGLPPRQFSATI